MTTDLDHLDLDFGTEPPHGDVGTLVARGATLRRARRRRAGAATLGVAAVAGAAGAFAVQTLPERGTEASVAEGRTESGPKVGAVAPRSWDDPFLTACDAGADPQVRDELFAGGRPRVLDRVVADGETSALLVAADGNAYGSCSVGAATYVTLPLPATSQPTAWSNSSRLACGPAASECVDYQVVMAGRRDPAVAAMDVSLFGGGTVHVETPDGYFLMLAEARLPHGWSWAPGGKGEIAVDGDGVEHSVIERIRLYDASGDLLAQGGSWATAAQQAAHPNPAGVPGLDAFPERSTVLVGQP